MKVGKEEIAGMLVAVEMWFKRDHAAEWKTWESRLDLIARSVTRVSGVSAEIIGGPELTLNCPTLALKWDGKRLGISAEAVKKLLEEGTPRIFLGESTGDWMDPVASSVTIRSLNMKPGQERAVAGRLFEVLSRPPMSLHSVRPTSPLDVSGRWDVYIEFVCGSAEHTFSLQQQGAQLTGTHKGEILTGDLSGVIEGDQVSLKSAQKYEGNWLRYKFVGTADEKRIKGSVDLGQYGQALWTAQKRS